MTSTRRLAAIMFTDMVGSTALAQTDEAEALKLRDEQEDLVRPLLKAHQGREVKSMGDGCLAEFDSALRAVECAIEIQQHLHERNLQPGTTLIRLRIGVHLGDVEHREADIFGDSVNVASRIEPLADPGGICITEPVYGQVRNKVPNRFEEIAPGHLKGLQSPIKLYRVMLPWADSPVGEHAAAPSDQRIVVLPFANLSPNPEDAFFASGVTEELLSAVSRIRELSVISRTSAMRYPPGSRSLREIGSELRAGFALEGSVRKAGNTVRISAQLVDVGSDRQLWADSFDRTLDDVFAVQSDVAANVAKALRAVLAPGARSRLDGRAPRSTEAYLLYLRGRASMSSPEGGMSEALRSLKLAVESDPTYAPAYAALAECYTYAAGDEFPVDESWVDATRYAQKAIELNPDLSEAHASLGILALQRDLNVFAAEREFRTAIALDPNNAAAHLWLGTCLALTARIEDGIAESRTAESLDPVSPFTKWFVAYELLSGRYFDEARRKCEESLRLESRQSYPHAILSFIHFLAKEPEAAIAEGLKAIEQDDTSKIGLEALGCAYALAGRVEEARGTIVRLERLTTRGFTTTCSRAIIELSLGSHEEALHLLEQADRESDPTLPLRFASGMLDAARGDPRFLAIARRRGWSTRP